MFRSDNRDIHDDRAAAREVGCDWVEPPSAPPTPPSGTSPPSSRPASLAPLSLAAFVSRRHAELSRLDHFELLGVPDTANGPIIARAFQREMARFNPDRLRGQDERLRPLASAILRRIVEAYRVLSDDANRLRYRRALEHRRRCATGNGGPGANPGELLQAARACLARGRHRDAALLMELACGVAPHDVRCQALLAWLRVLGGDARSAAAGDRLLALLTQAVRKYPDEIEFRLYRARALQRLGRGAEALRDFTFVTNADPRNVEAARELRLHHLRSRDQTQTSGVFSKFFASGASDGLEERAAPASPAFPAAGRQPRRPSSR